MDSKHIDYFLKRIQVSDNDKPFITTEEEFNTPSKTLKEFVNQDKDCNENGVFITYIFGNEEIVYGIARMKPISFEVLKQEIISNNLYE